MPGTVWTSGGCAAGTSTPTARTRRSGRTSRGRFRRPHAALRRRRTTSCAPRVRRATLKPVACPHEPRTAPALRRHRAHGLHHRRRARDRRRDRAAAARARARTSRSSASSPSASSRTPQRLGDRAACFEADVTDFERARSAPSSATVERFGGIDVAIANAGIAFIGAPRDDAASSTSSARSRSTCSASGAPTAPSSSRSPQRRGYLLNISSLVGDRATRR